MRKLFKKFTNYKTTINDTEEDPQVEDNDEYSDDDEYYEEEQEGQGEENNEGEEDEEENFEDANKIDYDSEKEEEGIGEEIEISSDAQENKEWLGDEYEEGQLSIDVYQTPENIVVKSTIAGVKPDDIDISINNDLLTIRGKREMTEKIKEENYLFRECYWGPFSRSVILPVEIIPEKIDAFLENGVLTIILPKAKTAKQITIKVKSK